MSIPVTPIFSVTNNLQVDNFSKVLNSPLLNWLYICSDTTGQYLAATGSQPNTTGSLEGVYTSKDYGKTWNISLNIIGCSKICSDSTGNYITVIVYTAIWYSNNGGSTWTQSTQTIIQSWLALTTICCSSDGKYIVISCNPGYGNYGYTSSDYGSTWIQPNVPVLNGQNWAFYNICSDSTGQKLIGCNLNAGIRISSDYGLTWGAPITTSLTYYINQICCSKSGKYIYAVLNNTVSSLTAKVLYSSDYGNTFTPNNVSTIPTYIGSSFISCSNSGQYVCMCGNYNWGSTSIIAYSSNYGVSWTLIYNISNSQLLGIEWSGICVNSAGCYTISNGIGNYSNSINNVGSIWSSYTKYIFNSTTSYNNSFTYTNSSPSTTISLTGKSGTGAITYITDNSNITISGSTITTTGSTAGTANITAIQAASGIYASATFPNIISVVIDPILYSGIPNVMAVKVNVMIASNLAPTTTQSIPYSPTAVQMIAPSSNSGGQFSYAIISGTSITLSGSTIIFGSTGITTITATQAAYEDYLSSITIITLSVTAITSNLASTTIQSIPYSDTIVQMISPESNSGGQFSYAIIDGTSITLSGSTIIFGSTGITTITATQAAYGGYLSGITTITLSVNAIDPNLICINPALIITFRDPSFKMFSSNNSVPIICTYTDSNIITIDLSGNATINNAGTTQILATQVASNYYLEDSVYVTINVLKEPDHLTIFTNKSTYIYGTPIIINQVESTYNLAPIIYSCSSNITIIDTLNTSINIISNSIGDAIITATQDMCGNILGGSMSSIFTILQAPPIQLQLNISMDTHIYGSGNLYPIITECEQNINSSPFVYTSSDTTIVDISGTTLIIYKVGSTNISVSQAADANCAASIPASIQFSVLTSEPIQLTAPILSTDTYTYGSSASYPTIILNASNINSSPFVYTSSDTTIVDISGTTLIIYKVGSTNITVSQAADANCTASIPESIQFSVLPIQTIFYTWETPPPSQIIGNSYQLISPISNSEGPIIYIYDPLDIISIDSFGFVTFLEIGTVNIIAIQQPFNNYSGFSSSVQIYVNGTTTPTITPFTFDVQVYSSTSFQVTIVDPISNSNGAFTYTSSNTSIVTISGNDITVLSAGTVSITATQAADGIYTQGSIVESLNILSNFQTFSMSLVGTYNPDNFGPATVDILTSCFATEFGVPTSYISLHISGGSIIIVVTISLPPDATSTNLASLSTALTTAGINNTTGSNTNTIQISSSNQSYTAISESITTALVGANINIGVLQINSGLIFSTTSIILNGANMNSIDISNGKPIIYLQCPDNGISRYSVNADITQNGTVLTISSILSPNSSTPFTGLYTVFTEHNNIYYQIATFNWQPNTIVSCYAKGTKILCIENGEEIYIPIETLKIGTMVKTYNDVNRQIKLIGKKTFTNDPSTWYNCMYSLPKSNPKFQDLVITGPHSILVDELTKKEQMLNSIYYKNAKMKIKDKYLLNAAFSNRFIKHMQIKKYTYYHIVLESDDDLEQFGIWADGVLSETLCKKYFSQFL